MASPILSQISLFPYDFAPSGWKYCDGSKLPKSDYFDLYEILQDSFGGDDQSFGLPDLRDITPPNCHYCMKVTGDFPVGSYPGITGETFFFASLGPTPSNMLECAGQPLAKGKHQYLETFMGTRFGGGPTTYNMPNLRTKSPMGLNYLLTVDGSYPESSPVRDSFLGELFLVPFELSRNIYLTLCNGKEMYAPQQPYLYQLLGNRFGGTNPRFNLPDLRGAAPSQFNYYLNLGGAMPPKP